MTEHINIKRTELTKGEQFIYDWQYRGFDENSFKGLLSRLLAKADEENLRRMKTAFPEEAIAMDNFHHKKGWWEMVQDIASIQRYKEN